ncbi:MAG: hybrid sensor histidine kinase/response regulator [Acidiferrobacter sp.]
MNETERVKILVVDDHQENLLALAGILENPQYEVIKALSGGEALKEVLRAEFAVILLDVQMPGLDGFETAALIRKRRKSDSVPIIFITAINKEEQYVYKGYALGAVDYLFKPVDIDILRSKVAVFVDLFQKNRQLKVQARLLQEGERRERARQIAEVQQRGERRYRNLADLVPQLVWTTNRDLRFEYVNQRTLAYFGINREHVSELAIENVVYPNDLKDKKPIWQKALLTGEEFVVEVRLRRGRDQSYRWHMIHVQPERDARGRVRSWLSAATDIDDQRRVAEALATEKEQLAVTLRSIGDGVITTDVAGRIILINRAAEILTGWTQNEALGKLLGEVFVVREDAPLLDRVGDGEILATESFRRAVLVDRHGRERDIADGITPIRDSEGRVRGTAVVFRDITDVQRLEEERQKASKLESVGLLAGAIAHDFNNILTAIMGNIALAKLCSAVGEQIFERLEEAERAALWAKDLTQQLLTFSKGGAPIKRPIEIAAVVRDSAEFACRGSHVLCEVLIATPVTVEADEGQIRQVIHNLVLNARQAMPDGGRVRVSVGEASRPDSKAQSLPLGRYAEIVCADEGIGINRENLSKIFDPYFTTKQHGSGLGLATSYSIVRKHNGLITVESEVGKGTIFRIYLPASEKPTQPSIVPIEAAHKGHGRILIMDDESVIRDILGRLFTHFGYEVGYAKDGTEALSAYKGAMDEGHRYDLVIMDLVIPGGMGGRETICKLLNFDPAARVIVSSGYSNDPIMANYKSYGFCEAVAKPYRDLELRTIVQKVLAR